MTRNTRARTFPDVIITARCVDCDLEFTGPIGVRITPQGPALEIVIACPKRNEIHAIARVPVGLIPVELVDVLPLPKAGTA
jgi:hypothetical protein